MGGLPKMERLFLKWGVGGESLNPSANYGLKITYKVKRASAIPEFHNSRNSSTGSRLQIAEKCPK